MLPLLLAAAVGGPVGGSLVTWFGLRPVATLSMMAAAFSLACLSFINLKEEAYLTLAILFGLLGFSLGVGLPASSIAITGGAPKEKTGAAGVLESTGYELGGGLGITIFGLLVNYIYRSSFTAINGIQRNAASSIGEAMTWLARSADLKGLK